MTNYKRGYYIENKRVNEWKKLGYQSIRTAGSHGMFDVIAWNEDEVWFEQLKRTKQYRQSDYQKDLQEVMKHKVPLSVFKKFTVYVDGMGWLEIYDSWRDEYYHEEN